jgi:hypothetical protein
MIRIYEVKTEVKDTRPGQAYDRFNVAAEDFGKAVAKATNRLKNEWKFQKIVPEKIQSITVLASEG